jgi:N-acetylglutamate synthase-like GNAT family acetyltransferase
MLCAHVARTARRAGARRLYAVTETADRFFEMLGFHPAGRLDDLPDVFREHMSFCAESAAVLRFEV